MAAKARKITTVEKKLIGVADVVIDAAQRRKDPTFAIPVRSLSNVTFDERKGLIELGRRKQARSFFNVGMAKKFMQTVLVADALCELQRANLTTSLREIYYRSKHTIKNSHENTLDTQDESDPLIEDLEVTLAALREELHVRAENAGSVVGPLVLVDDGDRVDCAKLGKGGYSVPSIVEPEYLQITRCTADFVLLVEKGTQWNRLSEDKFWHVQLRSSDGKRAAAPRRQASGAAAARGEAPPRLCPRGQRPVGLLHLLGHQAGLDQSRLRKPAHGHSEGQVHRALERRSRISRAPAECGHQAQRQRHRPRPRAPQLHVVPEEELAGGNQADALERAQIRAGRPRQQGLPVPHQEVSSPQAQRERLAGLGRQRG